MIVLCCQTQSIILICECLLTKFKAAITWCSLFPIYFWSWAWSDSVWMEQIELTGSWDGHTAVRWNSWRRIAPSLQRLVFLKPFPLYNFHVNELTKAHPSFKNTVSKNKTKILHINSLWVNWQRVTPFSERFSFIYNFHGNEMRKAHPSFLSSLFLKTFPCHNVL